MAKMYDVVATTGTYEKDGKKKYISRNVGSIIETRHGIRQKMEASFNPAGCPRDEDGYVWLALFEPSDNSQRQQNPQQNQGGGVNREQQPFNRDDDPPFAYMPEFKEVK